MLENVWVSVLIISLLHNSDASSKQTYKLLVDKYKSVYIKDSSKIIPNTTAIVELAAFIQHVNVLEDKQMLEVGAVLEFWWVDKFMAWDPERYGGLRSVRIRSYHFWKPDVTVINGFMDHTADKSLKYFVLSNKGEFLWYPSYTMTSYCPLDHTNYPFDKQRCSLRLGSMSYYQSRLDLRLYHDFDNQSSAMNFGNFYDVNTEWKISGVTEQRKMNDEGTYAFIQVDFTFSRRFTLYAATIIVPLGASSFLAVLMFLLPPWHRQKLTPGLLASMLQVFLLIHLSYAVPATLNTPKIVQLCQSNLIIVTVSLLCSILLVNISERTFVSAKDPPSILVDLIQGPFGKVMCINGNGNSISPYGNYKRPSGRGDSEDNAYLSDIKLASKGVDGWKLIALVLDRVFLIISIVVFFIVTFK